MEHQPDSPRRVQLSRRKGWRMPPNTVRVSRPSKFGNPFVVGQPGTHTKEGAVLQFRIFMDNPSSEGLRAEVRRELRGKNLACWCPLHQPCHADVLLELANQEQG